MNRKAYEKPLNPINPLNVPSAASTPMIAKCPGCGVQMVIKVTPLNLTWNINISSDPEEITKVKAQIRGKSIGY